MRILGVDYGDARTGLAISDPTGFIASEAGLVTARQAERVADEIAEHAKRLGAQKIVLGNPINMNASEGERSQKSAELAEMLRGRTGLEVILWDERRTTADAHRILSENGVYGKKRKKTVDMVAAVLILQGYLDFLRLSGEK